MKAKRLIWKTLAFGLIVMSVLTLVITVNFGQKKEGDQPVVVTMDKTYQNPMKLDQEWPDYGIGDPYIMRYNGMYYLYCSTKDYRIGVKAWSSADLVNWTYVGLVTEEPLTEGAYAPEVVHWNGSFYMYTSPAGKGHYVLRSDSPTGPFAIMTDNLGLTIDGSVFIDDNAEWFFTHAESGGIMGRPMSGPYTIEAGERLNASLGHWTEGSMIIKRNGRYFMTYTGNHVFSKGYRVNYAVAHDSPLGPYEVPENNPIIISTDDDFNGLGHSSTVLGPDMDSYYIVYHNLVGRSAEGPPVRKLNMDRLAFNGDKMVVSGPTKGPMPVPAMPVFYDRLGDGKAPSLDKWEEIPFTDGLNIQLSKPSTSGRFTAEYNAVVAGEREGSSSEMPSPFYSLFSFVDSTLYRAVKVDDKKLQLSLSEWVKGEERVIQMAPLPEGTDLQKLHTIRVESDEAGTRVYWDGLLLMDNNDLTVRDGRIGYAWANKGRPDLHYTAFSNEAGGSSDKAAIKPLPGQLEAVHYMTGQQMEKQPMEDGSVSVKLNDKGWLRYPVNVAEDGTYLISAMVKAQSAGAVVEVEIGGKSQRVKLPKESFSNDAAWTKVPLGTVKLLKGPDTLTLKRISGQLDVRYLEGAAIEPAPSGRMELLEHLSPSDMFGGWQRRPDSSLTARTEGKDSKLFAGSHGWTDYRVGVTLQQEQDTLGEGALLFRTTQESDFPEQVKDSFMGYELAFRNGRVLLRRVSYERNEEVADATLEIKGQVPVRIRVEVRGAALKVYAGEIAKPLIEWVDPHAFLHGRVGLRSSSPAWVFTDLTVEPIDSK
jgi:xylan 1,4-beta-xylosidase